MTGIDRMNEALRWLRFAREDVRAAERMLDAADAIARHVCWLAQQGAEKALKALLIAQGIEFPRTHDLDTLLNLSPVAHTWFPSDVDVDALSEWAVEARYPGDWEEASRNDAQQAVADACAIVSAAEQRIHTISR